MIERVTRSVVRHRARWTAALLVLLGVSLFFAGRLAPRDVASDFRPRDRKAPDSLERAVRTLLGGADRIVVLLEARRPVEAAELGPVIDTLAARLAALPDVRRVEYRVSSGMLEVLEREAPARVLLYFDSTQLGGLIRRVSRQHIGSTLAQATPDSSPGVPAALLGSAAADPLGVLAPAAAVLERALGGIRLRIADGYFALPGRTGFVLLVEPAHSLGDLGGSRALVAGVRRVLEAMERSPPLASHPAGLRLLAVGRPVSVLSGLESIRSDGLRVGVASAITAFVLLLLFFGRLSAPLILMGTVLSGLVVTAAVAHLLVGSVSVIAWVFVAVLVGLGDEFAFYIASHYWITGDPSLPRAAALASAIRRPARGLLFSGLAMAAAILSLAVVSYPVMAQLAWLAALGVLLMMTAGFFILPVALSYTAPARRRETRWFRSLGWLHRMGARPTRGLVVWSVLLAGFLFGASRLRFEPHPWKVVLRGNPSTRELERARQLLGVWPSPVMMVSAGRSAEEALARDRAAVEELDPIARRAGVVTIESLSRWIPPAEQQRGTIAYLRANAALLSPARFERELAAALQDEPGGGGRLSPEYRAAVGRLLRFESGEIDLAQLSRWGLDSLIARHLTGSGGQHFAVSYLYLERFPWTEGVMARFESTLTIHGGTALAGARFVGDAVGGSSRAGILRRDFVRATLLGLSLVALVLALQFRRLKPTLLCLVPLLCGVVAALGLMGLLGIELNVLTLSISPVLIGLSVDDGIHIMERLERRESTRQVLEDAGAPMIITTLTTVGGLACLGLARFEGVAELGLVGGFGILVALAASLHLLPALFTLVRSRPIDAP
jgi:predicted RND superfamily exporter protein